MTTSQIASIVEIIRNAATTRRNYAVGPINQLGVGHNPSDEDAALRRNAYLADAALLRSIADFIETREWDEEDRNGDELNPLRVILDLVHPVCSATAERIRSAIEGE